MTEKEFIDKLTARFHKSFVNGVMSRLHRMDGLLATHDCVNVVPIRHWCKSERLRAERECAND